VKFVTKAMQVVGLTALVLIAGLIALILFIDPPPLRLQDEAKFILSVPPPSLASVHNPLETGIACSRKLESYSSSLAGRPQITFFDWLRHQSGKIAEPDYHLSGSKPNDTWAFKVDRSAHAICYQKPSDIEAGITDPYCGLVITFESPERIIAVDNRPYDGISTALFNKKSFTLTMTGINVLEQLGADIEYFQCH
jgi:hypothetical protein